MAKKPTPSVPPKTVAAAPRQVQPAVVSTTAVRNSPLPKASPAKKAVTRDQIAVRAFEISCGPNCGTQDNNWSRAEPGLSGLKPPHSPAGGELAEPYSGERG